MTDHYCPQRRTFLKTIFVLGGVAASLSATKNLTAGKAVPLPAASTSGSGYTETEHIRKYYQTARS